MGRVWSFVKAVVVLGLIGAAGWFVWQKANEQPPSARDVRQVAYAVSRIIGPAKTELTQTDKPSVEFQVDKLLEADVETIKAGLMLLGPKATRAEYVAAELILLRVFENKPEGYVSRVDGVPWEVTGSISQMGQFEIDRTTYDPDSIEEMVKAFGPSATPREPWASNPGKPAATTQ